MFLNLIAALLGFALGGIMTFSALFGGFYIISFFITDQTAFGWVWVLHVLLVPLGALGGLILGYVYLGKVLNGFISP